jgi:hypothetical protein
MRHGPDRIRDRRRTVRISGWTKRRFTCESRVCLPIPRSADAPVVIDSEFHEQVVLLLPIVDGVALAHLARREKAQRTAAGNRPRFGTEHRSNAEAASAGAATSHRHAPVDASCLPGAEATGPMPIARLVECLHECDAGQSQVPPTPRSVDAVHRRDRRQPRCPRGFLRRRQERCRHRHVFVHVGGRRLLGFLRTCGRCPRQNCC